MARVACLLVSILSAIAAAAAAPAGNSTAGDLPALQTPLYALYLCSHPSPATSFFGFNYSTYNVTNAATATRRSKSTAKLAACPAVDSSADVDSDQSFTVPVSATGTASGPYLQPGVPYLLSFLRKPALGAVDVTVSVHLDGGARNDSTLLFRRTLTLASLGPPPADGDQAARRRLLTRSSAVQLPPPDVAAEDIEDVEDDQQVEGGLLLTGHSRTLLGSSSSGSSSGGGGRSSGGSSSGSSSGGRSGGTSSGGGRTGGTSSGGRTTGGSTSSGGGTKAAGSSAGSARSGSSFGSSGWTRNPRGSTSSGPTRTKGSSGARSSAPGFQNYGLTGWGRSARPQALAGTVGLYPTATYKGRSGKAMRFGGYHRYRRRRSYYYPDDGEYDYDGYEFYVPPEEAAFLGSSHWAFPPSPSPSPSPDNDTLAYGLPSDTAAALCLPNTAIDLPSSYTGVSVFKAGDAFQYQTDLEVPVAPGAPACKPCPTGSCCGSTRFANSNWQRLPSQSNRRGTKLGCGLVQDFVLDVALYLPTNAASVTITVHSVYATLNATTPCGSKTAASIDPSDPPLYLTLVPGDTITPNASTPSPPQQRRRSAAAPAAAPATWLLRLASAVLALLAAGSLLL